MCKDLNCASSSRRLNSDRVHFHGRTARLVEAQGLRRMFGGSSAAPERVIGPLSGGILGAAFGGQEVWQPRCNGLERVKGRPVEDWAPV